MESVSISANYVILCPSDLENTHVAIMWSVT